LSLSILFYYKIFSFLKKEEGEISNVKRSPLLNPPPPQSGGGGYRWGRI